MKKLSKTEKTILEIVNTDEYNVYRCPEHGIYGIRKESSKENHVCIYCKKEYPILSKDEIKNLI